MKELQGTDVPESQLCDIMTSGLDLQVALPALTWTCTSGHIAECANCNGPGHYSGYSAAVIAAVHMGVLADPWLQPIGAMAWHDMNETFFLHIMRNLQHVHSRGMFHSQQTQHCTTLPNRISLACSKCIFPYHSRYSTYIRQAAHQRQCLAPWVMHFRHRSRRPQAGRCVASAH